MKKTLLFACAAVMAGAAAHAGFVETETVTAVDVVSPAETIVTVSQARDMRDDTNVIMRGKIISRAADEKYTFQDDTGTIVVEIDDDDWNGLDVTANDTVMIYGDVDRGLFSTEIDVDTIRKM